MQITLEIFKRKRILESSKTYEYSTNVEQSIAHPSPSDFSVKNDLIVSLFTTPPERREGEASSSLIAAEEFEATSAFRRIKEKLLNRAHGGQLDHAKLCFRRGTVKQISRH